MKKYICTPCGYIYNPAVGDPDEDVAAGTAFEDLPEDWVCPVCGRTPATSFRLKRRTQLPTRGLRMKLHISHYRGNGMKEHSCQHAAEPCTRKVPIFAALTDEDLTRISAMIKHRKFTKGQPLILEGAPSDTLYIIQQGHVKLSKITPEGKEQILHILTNGDFFGELSIFNSDELSNFSAYALKDTNICLLTRSDMEQLMTENPDISCVCSKA